MSEWTQADLITSASPERPILNKKIPPLLEGLKERSDADHFQFLATTSARSTTRWL